jgi:methionine-rich copper-binding protein CopC
MKHSLKLLVTALFASLLATTAALAHAFLDHAVPGVGATVSSAPAELRLSFTQNIVPAFSSVKLAAAGGAIIPTDKAALEAGSANTLHVKLPKALTPGTYIVSWHVVSVDTHPTSGTYKFTIAP